MGLSFGHNKPAGLSVINNYNDYLIKQMRPQNNIAETLGLEPIISCQTSDNAPPPVEFTEESGGEDSEEPKPRLTGRGGPGRGQGRKPSRNEITHIREGFYGLIDSDREAEDLQQAWNMLKSIAINKALNDGDTDDLKWYLNKFIPNADRESAVSIAIGDSGMAPMITISMPQTTIIETPDDGKTPT